MRQFRPSEEYNNKKQKEVNRTSYFRNENINKNLRNGAGKLRLTIYTN